MKKIIKLSAVMMALVSTHQAYAKDVIQSIDDSLGSSTSWARWLPDSMNRFDVDAIYGQLSNGDENTPYAQVVPVTNTQGKLPSAYNEFFPTIANSWAGFRLGAGFNLQNNPTKHLDIQYLYLNSSAANSLATDKMLNLLTLFAKNPPLTNAIAQTQTFQQYQTLQFNIMPNLAVYDAGSSDYGFYYGAKGAYIKSGYNAHYYGTNGTPANYRDDIFISNELFGMGPQIGEAFKWAMTSWLDFSGNAFFGILFGNDRTRFNESNLPVALNGATDANLNTKITNSNWAALTLGGQFGLGVHKLDKYGNTMAVEGGIGGDQYISNVAAVSISNPNSTASSVTIGNNYTFRNVYIRLSYRADGVRSMDK